MRSGGGGGGGEGGEGNSRRTSGVCVTIDGNLDTTHLPYQFSAACASLSTYHKQAAFRSVSSGSLKKEHTKGKAQLTACAHTRTQKSSLNKAEALPPIKLNSTN